MKINKLVNFLNCNCEIVKRQYNNGRTALELIIAEDNKDMDLHKGESMAMATINIPEITLANNQVIIKDYSENKGILEALVEAGIVENTGKTISTGFVTCPICKLLI